MDKLTKTMMETWKVHNFYCERCKEELDPETLVWLEVNFTTNEWAKPGTTEWSDGPESQGCFSFGKACAKTVLKTQSLSFKPRK